MEYGISTFTGSERQEENIRRKRNLLMGFIISASIKES